MSTPGVVDGGVPWPPTPADIHGLPAPLAGGEHPDALPPAPLSVSVAPAEEASPAGRVPSPTMPPAAASLSATDFPEFGVGILAWLASVENVSLPSGSSDCGTLFAPGITPVAYGPTPLSVKPILSSRNLMTIARNAFGHGQAEQLIPALLCGFATNLSYWDIHERLRLLLLLLLLIKNVF